ncbi:MAG: nucleotidyltransferase family protein [Planctomycetes bacterium]|nr:nucleotidyltransferase family protein [Planctomycetota bacterium]
MPVSYEELLNRDARWAMSEGSRHFEEDSAVFKALHNIAQRLRSLGIPYAVVGGMALFRHGLRRFTEDVDILVTKRDLKIIHEKLEGLGYVLPFPKSRHLRDAQLGVKIEFLTTGDYPGDGKKKPVSFPDPRNVSFEADGISYINLQVLVELKLASGMTNPGRLKDLSDVLELIKALDLPIDFVNQLDPFVRTKFKDLWQEARKRYVTTWRNKWLAAEAKSIEDMISMLRAAADQLDQMRKDGVVLDDNGAVGDDYAHLVTMDAKVAEKYGLVDETEYWGVDDEDEAPDDGPTGAPPSE